ncbi:XRE family transcriptional regulator [Chryseobacterium pennae]|uniref:XRE family transcriptional regulator n=2 Tax=Chryseobacterium pennae TaxID=2258962 RepID=A0A3D9CB07_9FLAO|nr:XRE family transcriptional regulator [Chryseobacterium pennae]
MKICGQNIRKIRRSKDFTQEYMAFEMGISQKAYSDIENSKVKINLEILTKISDILEIKPSDICSISHKCGIDDDYEDKYQGLLEYMKKNNIPVPDEYLENKK